MTALTLILAIMIVSTGISSVFDLEVYEHQYAGGTAHIQVPCGPEINFAMYRACGDFGPADRIHIEVPIDGVSDVIVGNLTGLFWIGLGIAAGFWGLVEIRRKN